MREQDVAFPRSIGFGPFRRHRQPGEDPAEVAAEPAFDSTSDSSAASAEASADPRARALDALSAFEQATEPAFGDDLDVDQALGMAPGFGYRSVSDDVAPMAWRIPQRRRLALSEDLEPDLPEDEEEPVQGVRAPLHAAVGVLDPETEAKMPRWRRPSLQEARRADPNRTYREHESQHFEGTSQRERRVVRYRLVRMLNTPDELHGLETGSLDQGDEVEIVEQHGVYRFVVAPDGSSGWVHKMTLGEVVAPAV